MTNVLVDYPDRYDLEIDGNLTVKMVLPVDDGMRFICRGRIQHHEEMENSTILEITRGATLQNK